MPVIARAARWVSRGLVLIVFSLMLVLNVAALTVTGVRDGSERLSMSGRQ